MCIGKFEQILSSKLLQELKQSHIDIDVNRIYIWINGETTHPALRYMPENLATVVNPGNDLYVIGWAETMYIVKDMYALAEYVQRNDIQYEVSVHGGEWVDRESVYVVISLTQGLFTEWTVK